MDSTLVASAGAEHLTLLVVRNLGLWPWYILVAAGPAVAIFACLDLPFAILRRRSPELAEARP
ncbi:MAG TPA: hypothetical protein VGJ79_07410 [Candidatus Dormibacteraeota bacterium]